jgi:hypothetical protein
MTMADQKVLTGLFIYLDDLIAAIQELKREKVVIKNVYSPIKNAEILEAMGTRPSIVRLVTLIAGIVGGLSGLALATYAHLRWKLITSGKPILPWIPWVVVFFELLILISVLSTVAAMLIKGRVPRTHLPKGYNPRFSGDCFGIEIYGSFHELEKAQGIMKKCGAEEINEISF